MSCFKGIYFIIVTTWGYLVLKDTDFLPTVLGGKGEAQNSWINYPYPKHVPGLKNYLLIPMAYHVGGLFVHFLTTRKNDFIEMGLHHIVSFYLFSGCYMCNVWEIGSAIAFLHDIADVTTNIVKGFAETKYSYVTAAFFVTHMAIWFYTRNIILPWFIYNIYLLIDTITFNGEPIILPMFCYLLSCMFLLHCFWFYMFIMMLGKFIKSGKTEDE